MSKGRPSRDVDHNAIDNKAAPRHRQRGQPCRKQLRDKKLAVAGRCVKQRFQSLALLFTRQTVRGDHARNRRNNSLIPSIGWAKPANSVSCGKEANTAGKTTVKKSGTMTSGNMTPF